MKLEKLVFRMSGAGLLGLSLFAVGFFVAHKEAGPYRFIVDAYVAFKELASEATSAGLPDEHLQPSRRPGAGVTVGSGLDDGALILLSSLFDGGNELRLIRRDGTPVARWPVDYFTLFPDRSYLRQPPRTTLNADLHGFDIRPNGELAFNFEYLGAVGLDRCGAVRWRIEGMTHHSVENAEAGGYWILGRNRVDDGDPRFAPFIGPLWEDVILKVSDEGVVEGEISVPGAMQASGLWPLATVGRESEADGRELMHANRVTELRGDLAGAFPMFAAGDLLVSERAMNLLMVLDPQTGEVKWHQVGPYLRQHDPEFRADGRITVFNNNGFQSLPNRFGRNAFGQPANIMAVDPATGATEVIYGGEPGQDLASIMRGQQDPLPSGGLLITEFDGGRVFEVDAGGRVVWEYINRFDADHVAEITGARLFPAGYFRVPDWTCP